MTRMPFGRTLFRYSSVTRWIARVGVLQLFLVGQRGLIAERHLAAEPHLAVAVDLDHLPEVDPVQLHFVTDVLDAGQGFLHGLIVARELYHAGSGPDVDLRAGLLL